VNSLLQAMWLVIVQIAMLLAFSPFIVGLIRKVKARLQCRQGAGIFQPYADLAKLFHKQLVVSSTTSWIFAATPYIVFASTLAAGLLVPLFVSQNPFNFAGNVIALVYLLALGTFFLILAGLDAGSTFGGMGSSREAIVATLAEPAMMLSIFAIALTAGSTNLSTIVHKTALMEGIITAPPPHLMALVAFFVVALAETGRYLALLEWAAGIKLLVFLSVIANVFAPWGIATSVTPASVTVGMVVYFAKVSALALVIGVIESMFAKLRLFRVPELLGAAFILSLLALVFFYTLRG
jgi:formate hydrogenlyase subunit 4